MGDLDKAVRAAREAQSNGAEISDAAARVIASMYHNGQASASYSFVSTGAISDPTDVYRECITDYAALSADERLLADMLGTYLANRADRSAVPGWSGLWL
jgi:hypothetical protein